MEVYARPILNALDPHGIQYSPAIGFKTTSLSPVLAQHRRFGTSPTRENCATFGHEFLEMTMALRSHPTQADRIHFNF
jgi:hypothetical protein